MTFEVGFPELAQSQAQRTFANSVGIPRQLDEFLFQSRLSSDSKSPYSGSEPESMRHAEQSTIGGFANSV
jgi:hypothetical protein